MTKSELVAELWLILSPASARNLYSKLFGTRRYEVRRPKRIGRVRQEAGNLRTHKDVDQWQFHFRPTLIPLSRKRIFE